MDAPPTPVAQSLRPVWNLPTYLTFLRLALVPVLIGWLLASPGAGERAWIAGLFALGIASDFFDGYLARRWGQVTPFGVAADPVADKLLVLGTMTCLVVLGMLSWWTVVIVAGRELAVTIMRARLVRDGYGILPAGWGGKCKLVVQSVAVVLYLLPLEDWWSPAYTLTLRGFFLGATLVITLWTGLQYALHISQLRRLGKLA